MRSLLAAAVIACPVLGQFHFPIASNLGGGCPNRQNETAFPTIGVDSTCSNVLYLFDYAQGAPSFMVFDVLGGAQPFYPMPLAMSAFGAGQTCFLRVQWCAVTSSLAGVDGSFPIPPGWHGSLRCQQLIFDTMVLGGFCMSDVAELVL